MTFTENDHNGVRFLTAPVIPVPHAFTTRYGGVSTGIFESLNFSSTRGDPEENVRENYRRLALATGIDVTRMAFTRQVHGNAVRICTMADCHTLYTPVPYEADGLVTAERGLALICFTADCIPVLLCDAENGVIAAVHCGWRSSVSDILGNTLDAMRSLGAEPARIGAAIGPGIGACCFEVGPEVPEAVCKWLGSDADGLSVPEPGREGKYLLDLKGANARRLLQLGLRPENIAVSDACTVCSHEMFWSHRYTKGQRGSQASLLVLPD